MAGKLNSLNLSEVIAHEFDAVAVYELYPVTGLDSSSVTSSVLLLLKLHLETLKVNLVALFRCDEL